MRPGYVLAIASLALAGCSAIVSLSDDDIRCVAGASDPCPDGRQCRDGFCVLIRTPDTGPPDTGDGGCVPDERGELCGGGDEDCDGIVDETHDQDEDGFTWCGGGEPNQVDCDDNDPDSHPGNAVTQPAPEQCDGADNDCDGMIDEDDGSGELCPPGLTCIDRVCADPSDCSLDSVSCPMGQRCDFELTPPGCVAGGCTAGSCPGPEICNQETGRCVTPAAVGESCETDTDCIDDAICVQRAALGLGSGRICSEPCCAEGQCSGSNVCWAAGTGVELCVPPSMVGSGSGAPGSSCGTAADCRSGVCDGGSCVANCATDDDCGGSLACAAIAEDMSVQFACGTPGGPVGQGDADLFGEGCSSRFSSGGACTVGFPRICGPICVGSCRTSADCPSSISDLEYYCGFGAAEGYSSIFANCTEKRHTGAGEDGASCSTNSGCRDLACLSDRCADTCCTDADCSGSRRCKPIQIRGQWESHCI